MKRKYNKYTLAKLKIIVTINPRIYVRDLCDFTDISVGSSYNYIRDYMDGVQIKEIDKKHRNRLQQSRLLHYILDDDSSKILNKVV